MYSSFSIRVASSGFNGVPIVLLLRTIDAEDEDGDGDVAEAGTLLLSSSMLGCCSSHKKFTLKKSQSTYVNHLDSTPHKNTLAPSIRNVPHE